MKLKTIIACLLLVFLIGIASAETISYTLSEIRCDSNSCSPINFTLADGTYNSTLSIIPYKLVCSDKCNLLTKSGNAYLSTKGNECSSKLPCLEYTRNYYTKEQLTLMRDSFAKREIIKVAQMKSITYIDDKPKDLIYVPPKIGTIDNKGSWILFVLDFINSVKNIFK